MTSSAADLAAAVIQRLEHTHTRSAAVLRLNVYGVLREVLGDLMVAHAAEKARHAFVVACEARVARSTKRRAQAEARLAAVKRRPLLWPTEPTRELVAQMGEEPETAVVTPAAGPVPALRSHRWEWPVDRIAPLLTAAEYQAAEQLQWAWETKRGSVGSVLAASDAGRATPGKRLPLTPDQETAAKAWRAYWRELVPSLRPVAYNLILQQPLPGEDQAPTLEAFGRWYGRALKYRAGGLGGNRARGLAEGALRAACAALARIAAEYGGIWDEPRERRELKVAQKRITAQSRQIARLRGEINNTTKENHHHA